MTNPSGRARYPLRSHAHTLSQASAPALSENPARAASTESRASVSNARPVSPDLLYSRVVSGSTSTSPEREREPPVSPVRFPSATLATSIPSPETRFPSFETSKIPSPASAMSNPLSTHSASQPVHSLRSEPPRLTPTVDWGLLDDEAMPMPRSVAMPRTRSVGHDDSRYPSDSTSPVSHAIQNMSISELVSVARRHQALAQEALAAASERGRTMPADENLIDIHARDPSVISGTPGNSVVSRAVPSGEGPSRQKDKGVDPRNWGAIDFARDFTAHELKAQRAALRNFDQIARAVKTEEDLPPPRYFDPTPLNLVSPEPRPVSRPTNDVVSGRTIDEQIADLQEQISGLKQSRAKTDKVKQNLTDAQKAVKNSIDRHISVPPPLFRPDPSPAARVVPGSYVDRTLRNAIRVDGSPPSSDPSDSSSSDSEAADVSGSGRSHPSRHRRRSSKHRRSKRKMLLRPIPPKEYDGSPDAVAFHRFVKEGSNYVQVGRVPVDQRVFYLSYYLKNNALEFYNSKVENDEHAWTLGEFFWGLFNFCFPVNFREKQRTRLRQCVQGSKSVLSHKAEWERIFNTIGLEANQEKVVMFWRSLNSDIRREMLRDKLDPERSSWAEVTTGAESAEIIVNVGRDDDDDILVDSKIQLKPDDSKTEMDSNGKQRAGGRVLSVSAADIEPPRSKQPDKSAGKHLSAKKRAEYLAAGLCFNCGEHGHLSRNCPKLTNISSHVPGKPPGLATHSTHFATGDGTRNALFESTEVLETFHVGAASIEMVVEEGGGTD